MDSAGYVQERLDAVLLAMKRVKLPKGKLIDLVENPERYPQLEGSAAQRDIGWLQGFAAGADMTLTELLDSLHIDWTALSDGA